MNYSELGKITKLIFMNTKSNSFDDVSSVYNVITEISELVDDDGS